jgi:hypothetical protein
VEVIRLWRFLRVLFAARVIQDYLLGGAPGRRTGAPESYAGWVRVVEKRILKLREIDPNNPSWRVEVRKRLLQCATVSVGFMEALNNNPELRP